jgi:predicted secreted Zn-dependent protease
MRCLLRLPLMMSAVMALTACASTRNRGPAPDSPVQVTQRVVYYQVDLLDPRTLSRAMWDQGMTNESGVVGVTRTRYQWFFQAVPDNDGSCTIRSVRVTGEIRITLPRWTAPAGTSPERRSWWSSYSSAVNVHENTHVSIMHEYFQDMLRTLEGLKGGDCTLLRARGYDILEKGARAMEQRQQEFDRTDRGIPLGYPPPD